MVIVDTSFKKLQGLVKKKISLEELEETLVDLGMELDEVEGDEIKIEITAERVDLITPEGLARAINSYKGFVKKYEEIKINKSKYVHKIDSSVKKYRPFTRSFVVKGVDFDDENIKSLMWIQEKLHDTYGRKRKKVAIGVYDLSKINFPVTYCAKKPELINFVPLGMREELSGMKILQRHPTGRDYAHLLEGSDKFPLQIDNNSEVLSMPPIINSARLGKIDSETEDIFVECTGPSEEALDDVMNILATMFNDWGGKIFSVEIKDGKKSVNCPNLKKGKRKITANLVNKLIGLNLKTKDLVKFLPKMQYNVSTVKGEGVTVEIPSVRTDVWHEVDIADDVARAYGYNNIKPTLPNVSTIGERLPFNIFVEDLCNLLVGRGLVEVKTFALTNHQDQYVKMDIKESEHVALGKNTEDKGLSMVRSWLIPEVIKSLVANRNKEYPHNVFEVGIVVHPDKKADVKSRNVEKLVCGLCEEKIDFTQIKQVLDGVFSFIGLEYSINEVEHGSFISGRAGNVYVGKEEVGIIGEVSPQVLDNWGLAMPLAALELDLRKIFSLVK
ncbi:phenylalanine--tRNA ligase subunit beta [Candidatus Woesearchaeota archaeon]|jgi:phenylalanyl-tRNA synthetase beta chain|nr:phenylalanine--tRNA ligase subunit beta [Candidatus Woesearchaeota archaeon]